MISLDMSAALAKMATSLSETPSATPEIVLMKSVFSCAALLALFALGGCKTEKANVPPPSGDPIPVKAGDLISDYASNAVGADGKYKGKLLKVTGKFSSASKVPLMGYAVELVGEDQELNSSAIQCFILESAQAAVGNMKQGQIVTLQGICDGQPVPGQTKMSKCTVVQ
jgi:hypothetical protein